MDGRMVHKHHKYTENTSPLSSRSAQTFFRKDNSRTEEEKVAICAYLLFLSLTAGRTEGLRKERDSALEASAEFQVSALPGVARNPTWSQALPAGSC